MISGLINLTIGVLLTLIGYGIISPLEGDSAEFLEKYKKWIKIGGIVMMALGALKTFGYF